jgi:hypothetical protein
LCDEAFERGLFLQLDTTRADARTDLSLHAAVREELYFPVLTGTTTSTALVSSRRCASEW